MLTSIAKIPESWARTSRKPLIVDGIEWRSYRRGIGVFALVAEIKNYQCLVYRSSPYAATFSASIDNLTIGVRYRSEQTAAIAVKAWLNKNKGRKV